MRRKLLLSGWRLLQVLITAQLRLRVTVVTN